MIGNSKLICRCMVVLLWVIAIVHSTPSLAKITYQKGTYTISLADLMVRDEPIMLRGAASEYSISIPLAKRMLVTGALLDLRFVNSISLLSKRSQLGVFLNNNVIAQVPLKGKQPEGRIKVRLPSDMLKAGYNKLTFSVAQHYSENCEDPASKELWTQIDSVKTQLKLKAGYRNFAPTLADLPELFDERLWMDYRLQILTAGKIVTENELKWGSLIAQGVALRLNYITLEVTHQIAALRNVEENGKKALHWFPGLDESSTRGHDTVMVGTKETLTPYITKDIATKINGAFLGIYPREDDQGRYVLIVSGRTVEEVQRAALALAFPTIEFPDSRDTLVDTLSYSSLPAYSAKRLVQEGQMYNFADLGYNTTTSVGLFPSKQEVKFWVPPDLFVPSETSSLELHLHLAYGAGLGLLSAFNVYLNEEFQHAIHMQLEEGAVYYDYVIRMPMRSLRPGLNTLTFSPYMMPLERSAGCQPSYVNGLLVTLFDDSYIRLAKAAHFASLPDLKLFASTLFPYGVDPNGADFSVQVTNSDSRVVSATWALLARMVQILGSPFTQTHLGYSLPADGKHLLVVGVQREVEPLIAAAAPFSVADLIRSQTLILEMPKATRDKEGIFNKIRHFIGTTFAAKQVDEDRADSISLSLPGAFSEYAAITQFESPLYANKSVITLTAAREDTLNKGVHSLVKPALWATLWGGYALWQPKSMHGEGIGSTFSVGEVGFQSQFVYIFSQNPYICSAILVLLLTLLVVLMRVQLMRYKRRHHGSHADEA